VIWARRDLAILGVVGLSANVGWGVEGCETTRNELFTYGPKKMPLAALKAFQWLKNQPISDGTRGNPVEKDIKSSQRVEEERKRRVGKFAQGEYWLI
jgi:hypothetical protein